MLVIPVQERIDDGRQKYRVHLLCFDGFAYQTIELVQRGLFVGAEIVPPAGDGDFPAVTLLVEPRLWWGSSRALGPLRNDHFIARLTIRGYNRVGCI